MSNIDMSLDDIIDKSSRRGGRTAAPRANAGRAPGGARQTTGRAPGGRAVRNTRSNTRAEPYARAPGGKRASKESDHMASADVRDVAASRNPLLKVSSESKPNTVAGAICNVVRESQRNDPPNVMATGPAAVNQAMKAIAIARKYLLDEETPIDLLVFPKFEQDIREGSNLIFELKRSTPISREPSESDLSCKDKTDAFKLAGAIAGRVRDGEEVALTVKGPVPVLVSVKAIALAQQYVQEEGIDLKFAVQFRDLEDPELNNTPSTYLHMAIMPRNM